jgi:hypothetical protein
MTSVTTSGVTSRATCRGTHTRGGGEEVDDEPARGGVVDDERRTRSRASVATRQVVTTHGVAEVELAWPQDEIAAHGVVDDEPCDGPRDVPRHPDARRR